MEKLDFKIIVTNPVKDEPTPLTLPAIVKGVNYETIETRCGHPLTVNLVTKVCGPHATAEIATLQNLGCESIYLLDISQSTILGIDVDFSNGSGKIYCVEAGEDAGIEERKFEIDADGLIIRYAHRNGQIKPSEFVDRMLFEAGGNSDEIRYDRYKYTIDAVNLYTALMNRAQFKQPLLETSTISQSGFTAINYFKLTEMMGNRLEVSN